MSSNILRQQNLLPSKYDREFYLKKGEKSKRFDKLRPLVVSVLFNERKSFEYVRNIALARLEKTLLDQLNFLGLGDVYDYSHLEKLSKGIFSWGAKEFFKRRKLKKAIWVEILRRESNKKLLEGLKILTDLREIKKWIQIIFDLFEDVKKFDSNAVENLIWRPMREVDQYSDILDALQENNQTLLKNYQDLRLALTARYFNKRQSASRNIIKQREIDLLNKQASDPIEIRHIVNWFRNNADQVDLRQILREQLMKNNINKQETRMDLEDVCNVSICDFYYALTEQFKTEINALQRRYDAEVEVIDNDINYTRIQMKKLRETRKYLDKKLVQYREEIQVVLDEEEQIRLAAEEQERLRLEQEAFLESERLRLEELKAKKAAKAAKAAAKKGKKFQ